MSDEKGFQKLDYIYKCDTCGNEAVLRLMSGPGIGIKLFKVHRWCRDCVGKTHSVLVEAAVVEDNTAPPGDVPSVDHQQEHQVIERTVRELLDKRWGEYFVRVAQLNEGTPGGVFGRNPNSTSKKRKL